MQQFTVNLRQHIIYLTFEHYYFLSIMLLKENFRRHTMCVQSVVVSANSLQRGNLVPSCCNVILLRERAKDGHSVFGN